MSVEMLQRTYFVRNCTVDVKAVHSLLPDAHKFIWPMEVLLFDEGGELVVCLRATTEFRHVKGKVPA